MKIFDDFIARVKLRLKFESRFGIRLLNSYSIIKCKMETIGRICLKKIGVSSKIFGIKISSNHYVRSRNEEIYYFPCKIHLKIDEFVNDFYIEKIMLHVSGNVRPNLLFGPGMRKKRNRFPTKTFLMIFVQFLLDTLLFLP